MNNGQKQVTIIWHIPQKVQFNLEEKGQPNIQKFKIERKVQYNIQKKNQNQFQY